MQSSLFMGLYQWSCCAFFHLFQALVSNLVLRFFFFLFLKGHFFQCRGIVQGWRLSMYTVTFTDILMVSAKIKNKAKQRVKVVIRSHWAHPLILGTDWPGFEKPVGQCVGVLMTDRDLLYLCCAQWWHEVILQWGRGGWDLWDGF